MTGPPNVYVVRGSTAFIMRIPVPVELNYVRMFVRITGRKVIFPYCMKSEG